jgi:hypothetical protein
MNRGKLIEEKDLHTSGVNVKNETNPICIMHANVNLSYLFSSLKGILLLDIAA